MPELEQEDDAQQLETVSGRPIWSGTVSFGLVSVPVNIVSANLPRPASLHMVSDEGQQLRRRYFRSDDDTLLEPNDIVRGYEVEKGKYVVIDDDELERLAPERTRDIDLRVFVAASAVDPMYFVRGYFLTPSGPPKAYKLLARAMEERGCAGIATFVMRAREYVAAIFAQNGILRLETLRFADEVRSAADVGLPAPAHVVAADVSRIRKMVQRLAKTKLELNDLEDESAEKLERIAKRKANAGSDVIAAPADAESPTAVVDLVERLRKSLAGDGAKRKRA